MEILRFLGLRKEKEPPEKVMKKWQRELRKLERSYDRELTGVARLEAEARRKAKNYTTQGNDEAAKSMMKTVAQMRATRTKWETYKQNVESTRSTIEYGIMDLKHGNVLKQSTELMGQITSLSSLKTQRETMQQMARELTKVGLVGEMKDELWADLVEDGDEEEMVGGDDDIDAIMAEITGGTTSKQGVTQKGLPPSSISVDDLPSVPSANPSQTISTPPAPTPGLNLEDRFRRSAAPS